MPNEINIPGDAGGAQIKAFSVDQFRAAINRRGVARNNFYAVQFPLTESVVRNIGIVDSYSTTLRDIMMYAESATLPGLQLATTEVRNQGVGPVQYRPYAPLFSREITINFIVDNNGIVADLFYTWMRTAVNYTSESYNVGAAATYNKASPFEVSYPEEYQVNMSIEVKDSLIYGVDNKNEPTTKPYILKYNLYNAYPVNVMDMRVSYGAQDQLLILPVSFNYYHWYCETIQPVGNQPVQQASINQGPSNTLADSFNPNITNRPDQTGVLTQQTRGNRVA